MSTYITLINWTEQGVRNVRDSPKRLDAAREVAEEHGCRLVDLYMTVGQYDLVAVMEAPDDESAAKTMLSIAAGGNVRTTTLKAFPEAEYRKILASL